MFFLTILQALQLASFGAAVVTLTSDQIPLNGVYRLGNHPTIELVCDGKSYCSVDLPPTELPRTEYDHVTEAQPEDVARANRALAFFRSHVAIPDEAGPSAGILASNIPLDRCADLGNPKVGDTLPAHSLVCLFEGRKEFALIMGPHEACGPNFCEYTVTPLQKKNP